MLLSKLITILLLPFLLTACARAEGALAPTGVAADVPTTDYSDQVEISYLPDVDAASLAPVINYVDGLNLALTGDFEYIKTAAVSNCGCLDIAKRLQAEQRGGVIDVVEDEGRRLVDRRGARAGGRVGLGAGMDGQRVESGCAFGVGHGG